ncbi:MAG: insulinase family protein [Flavobacteriales bacterium]|jgi:predicted Zn-dependent peptidase|nr:insulinase family protein [Flavobacteriales bacterium]
MEFYTHTLSNGIRVIHKEVTQEVAHFGWMVQVGSRHEETSEFGLAHFVEHCLFKGTKNRRMHHILSRMEDVGGELNAYTTKEETFIYSSFLRQDYKRAMELISDIVNHSVFPEKELMKEKEVIFDEINSYKDNPSEQIFDEIDEIVFKNSDLGNNILGSEESVASFTREHIQKFIQKNYSTEKMILSSVGNIKAERLFAWAEKYFGSMQFAKQVETKNTLVFPYEKQLITKPLSNYQTHCILANRAYGSQNKDAKVLILLNNIFGGPGLNSRLNMSIREKHGFTYSIESNYHYYSDAGIFTIYFGTDKRHLNRVKKLIAKECNLLIDKKLTPRQLMKAKKQLLGQIFIAQENNCNLMLSMAKSLSLHKKVDTIEEIIERIESIQTEEIQSVASKILNPNALSTLEYTQP